MNIRWLKQMFGVVPKLGFEDLERLLQDPTKVERIDLVVSPFDLCTRLHDDGDGTSVIYRTNLFGSKAEEIDIRVPGMVGMGTQFTCGQLVAHGWVGSATHRPPRLPQEYSGHVEKFLQRVRRLVA